MTVHVTNLSPSAFTSWLWDFGDGSTSVEQHPSHEYANAGAYTASLTATNAGGSDTETNTYYIVVNFTDVLPGYWTYDEVMACVNAGIVEGFSQGGYQPDLAVGRDAMAVFIARAKGWINIGDPMDTAPELFPDVPAGFWAGTAIQACVDNGVVDS